MTDSRPLNTMVENTPTVLWNDSSDPEELRESISYGAVGATCNPVIALAAIKADLPRWSARIAELAQEMPTAGESEIGWKVVEEVSIDAAKLLMPAFEKYKGVNGRLSMQTDPRFHRDAKALADQAEHFSGLAPNIIVKIPATATGIEAIEDATYRGVSINVTVSFTVAQAVAAGEAIERGLKRREAEGLPIDEMGPVVTIMCGRLDDWMKVCYNAGGFCFDPGYLEWAGVAAFKEAYRIFGERGLRARLLSAAYRNALQWTEFVGGKVVLSPPFAWQKRFQDSGIEPTPRMDVPVDPEILEALETIPEFHQAYDVDGMTPEEFIDFGATRKTLRQFLQADADLDALVRDTLVPAP
ncbi:transaldolase family protein [Mobilicoccus pelagius]|uniref:Transaldolase/glucose-6-phosphate isomerase n=1 Tax=Mobilicoccus pelagius NBRC 104925 TaxID=1089455 RepID=H5USW9_9MICO|nr:transaldolase family protein [Mobilicoccus pelagius]GAB48827.1 transaldolase/glucose-6-phosphate isomerase [Mobilicoccus pelagius NBRC 104925]